MLFYFKEKIKGNKNENIQIDKYMYKFMIGYIGLKYCCLLEYFFLSVFEGILCFILVRILNNYNNINKYICIYFLLFIC